MKCLVPIGVLWLVAGFAWAEGEAAKAHVAAFWDEVWNGKDLAAIPRFVHDDFVLHSAGKPVTGIDAFIPWVEGFQRAITGIQFHVDDLFYGDGKVVTRWHIEGRHNGAFGLPATNQPFTMTGLTVFVMDDGKIREGWVERSALEALRALKSPEQSERP